MGHVAVWAMWLCGPCQARALQAECIGASVASELYAYVAWGATMHLVLWGASVTCPTVELMFRMRRWYNLTCPNLFSLMEWCVPPYESECIRFA